MKLEQSFDVAAPVDRVWNALIDIERVAPCLPGAAISGRNDDGTYNGTFTVKIGPTTAAYSGKLEMEEVDEPGRTATMQAQGTDRRGQGGAKATIVSKVTPGAGDGAHVAVSTDLHITGRLARFGRGGMIEDISERVMRQFADNLQAALTATPEGGEAVVVDEVSAAGAAVAAQAAAAVPAQAASQPGGAGSWESQAVPGGTASAGAGDAPGGAEAQGELAAAVDAAPASPGPETTVRESESQPLPEGGSGDSGASAAEELALAGAVDAAPATPGPETEVAESPRSDPLPEGAENVDASPEQARLAAAVDAGPGMPDTEATATPADPGFNPPASSEPFDAGSAVGGAVVNQLKRNAVPAGLVVGFVLALIVFLRGRRS